MNLENVVINTKRLILREFEETDLNDFYEYAKVEGVGESAGWSAHKSINHTKKILDWFIEEKTSLAIVLKDSNKVIGSIAIHNSNKDLVPDNISIENCKSIGYVVSKDYWGKDRLEAEYNTWRKEGKEGIFPQCRGG